MLGGMRLLKLSNTLKLGPILPFGYYDTSYAALANVSVSNFVGSATLRQGSEYIAVIIVVH